MSKLYLYLARRDSKGIKILIILSGKEQQPTRITDLSLLNLPNAWQVEIQREIDDNKMLWEPFLESATDYKVLKQSLKNRGFINLPLNDSPKFIKGVVPPAANTSKLPKTNSMIRKQSS